MKEDKIFSLAIIAILFCSFGIVSAAEPCDLTISLINQDPYPAIQGDYVKVVFQIDGIENSDCGTIIFGVNEDYPIYLDPNVQNPIIIKSGGYERNYGSFYLAPYKLRVDENALDGENPIEVYYSTRKVSNIVEKFNLTVENTRADFEIHVKDYDYGSRELIVEILNIGKVDVKALTLQIPKQENIEIKGTNRVVVGDLDSNEYTTADFEAILKEGESKINMNIIYTDSINVRREIQKVVDFDSSYFSDRKNSKSSQPYWLYILLLVIIAFFVWRIIRKKKKEAERKRRRE